MGKNENEDKTVTAILKKLIDELYSYVNSETLSTQILQEAPKLNTFSKTRIDGEIQSRMTKAFTLWLEKYLPQTVKSEFDNILKETTDGHEKMINVFQNIVGVYAFANYRILGLQGAVLTAAGSFALLGYSVPFVGPLVPYALTWLGLWKAVHIGIKYVYNISPEADVIVQNSIKTLVKSVTKESLKTFFVKNYDKHLRKFYQDILREHLPAVDSNLSFILEMMRKDADKLDKEHNINKEMSLKMRQFHEEVVKLLSQ